MCITTIWRRYVSPILFLVFLAFLLGFYLFFSLSSSRAWFWTLCWAPWCFVALRLLAFLEQPAGQNLAFLDFCWILPLALVAAIPSALYLSAALVRASLFASARPRG